MPYETDYDDFETDYRHERSGWQRHLYKTLLSVGVVALVLGGVFYFYGSGTPANKKIAKSGAAPLIKADAGPIRVKPTNPGGIKVPHGDKEIYRKIEEASRKTKKNSRPARKGKVTGRSHQGVEDFLAPGFASRKAGKNKRPNPAVVARLGAISRGKTCRLGQHGYPALKKMARQPWRMRQYAMRIPPGVMADYRNGRRYGTNPDGRRVSKISPAAGNPGRTTRSAAALIGPYRIQLGSFRSARVAQRRWRRVSKRQKALLGRLKMVIERVDLGPRGVFFRLQAGPLKSVRAVRRLCYSLKRRKIGCILVSS